MRMLVTLLVSVVAQLGAQTPAATITVTGQVVAEATGQPIRRALVVAHSPSAKVTRATMSDLEGRFTFDELPAGQYRVGASKAPWIATAVDAGNDPVLIRLPAGAVVTGVVTDEEGRPTYNAEVVAAESGTSSRFTTRTNIRGEYRLHSLPPGVFTIAPATGGTSETVRVTTGRHHAIGILRAAPRDRATTPPSPAVAARFEAPVTRGTARVEGRVLDVTSEQPLADVTVSLRRGERTAVTDTGGRFRFDNLGVGTFDFRVNQPGYAPASAATVPVRDGEHIDDVVLTAGRHGSIQGTVRDETGDAPVGLVVRVFQKRNLQFFPMLFPRGDSTVDDLGHYEVGNLPPGDYVVCACIAPQTVVDPRLVQQLGPAMPGTDELNRLFKSAIPTFPPTYFPGQTRGVDSVVITVDHNDDRYGLDITVYGVKPVAILGQLIESGGPPSRPTALYLIHDGDLPGAVGVSELSPTVLMPDGRFRFAGVPAGLYSVVAAPADGKPGPWGETAVTVSTSDIDNIGVTLGNGLTVRGRIEFTGGALRPPADVLQQARIGLVPQTLSASLMIALSGRGTIGYTGQVDADGNFVVEGVSPGELFVTVSFGARSRLTVDSVIGGGSLSSDATLTVGATGLNGVVVNMTDRVETTVRGTVTLDRYQAPGGWRVVIFPADSSKWPEWFRYREEFSSTTLDAVRSFTFRDLPPGDYFVATMSSFDAEMAPSSLARWAETAERITIRAGGTVELSLSQKIPSPAQ